MNSSTIIKSLLLIASILLINSIASYINIQMDLTKDNMYSISPQSKEILKGIEDKVFIKVYLKGEFPAGFKRLQRETYNLLKSFKEISSGMIDFEFISLDDINESNQKKLVFQQLIEQGLAPTDLEIRNKGSLINQIIFPGAIIYYKDKHTAVNFLKNKTGIKSSQNINSSIENLEFEFISSILNISRVSLERIAFLEGNGELSEQEVYDVTESVMKDNFKLSYYYNVDRFNIKEFMIDSITMQPDLAHKISTMNKYKAIIIAKPTIPFNKIDKLIIDQYIMNGGRVLWIIDGVKASMDSLSSNRNSFIANYNNLNLDDQLFKYGVRINPDLIEDLRSTNIPIVTGYSNNIPQQTFFKWPYYPLLFSENNHPVSRNLDAVKCNFVSSIDTINNNIKKTILLNSSDKSRSIIAPAEVSLKILEKPPLESTYNKSKQIISVLLEGKFESVFKNRLLSKNHQIKLKEISEENKMIVVSDGDLIANKVSKNGTIFPLGYDKYIEYAYPGNKYFIINAIQYLCDSHGVTTLKSKTLQLRMLDKEKTNTHRLLIQLLNIFLPLLLLFLFSIFYNIRRNKIYV